MHPVESAFRRWCANHPVFREVMHNYPELLRKALPYMDDRFTHPAVAFPSACVHMAVQAAAPRLVTQMDYANELAQAGNIWMAYRENRHIYQFTKELTKELAKLKQPLQLPARAIHLPRRGIVLDFSSFLGAGNPSAHILASYDSDREGPDGPQRLQIRICQMLPSGELQLVFLVPSDLDGRTLWQASIDGMISQRASLVRVLGEIKNLPWEQRSQLAHIESQWDAEIRHYDRDLVKTPEEFMEQAPVIALVINALFYLQGDEDVVKTVHPGMAPERPKRLKHAPNLQKLNRRLDNATETVQPVGEKFTAAIAHYEIERERLKAEHADTGGTKCPHLRAPHLHAYRTGEGRLDLCLKFLGWIGVAGAKVPEAMRSAFATITRVK